jgi:hypothetical protein
VFHVSAGSFPVVIPISSYDELQGPTLPALRQAKEARKRPTHGVARSKPVRFQPMSAAEVELPRKAHMTYKSGELKEKDKYVAEFRRLGDIERHSIRRKGMCRLFTKCTDLLSTDLLNGV